MLKDWINRALPRGLYGRAALILVAPIVAIQLILSIAFIQRHFEDVTRQMTHAIVLDIGHLADLVAAAPDRAAALAVAEGSGTPLELAIDWPEGAAAAAPPDSDTRLYYDFSGRVIIATLRAELPGVRGIDLRNLREVRLGLDTAAGPVTIRFDRRRVSASNPHQFLVLMAATGLLMALIAFIFLRNQLRPIRQLARAAEAFGRGRVLAYRPAGAAEVRAAGNAFLDMRARIERQIEQRTQLLSGVSHDLRTPLTRLKLGLSLIDGGAGSATEIAAMGRDVADMQRLLDAFLDFSRSDALDEPAEPADPVSLLRQVVADAHRSGQPVDLVAVEGAGLAPLRRDAVRRALENLIGNAVRYGNRAEVSVAVSERAVRISVEDDGPGIPREQRDEALRPFTRLDRARNQDRGPGVGLGLAITADIARSHGGVLRLGDSERLGGLKAELILSR
ncbi:MAG: two-component sensor histidine kinase [Alphaproteobacteria bacterium HGW-Alphaproteobacteria-6]|nr:MAG: two-component sensor histidine kinase [Alphaproteobacteria bacterium HGW-Alphaproteobacteria-6]